MWNKSTKTISPETILASQSAINSNSGNQINNQYVDNKILTLAIIYGGIHLSLLIIDKTFVYFFNKENKFIGDGLNKGINLISDSYKEELPLKKRKTELELKIIRNNREGTSLI